MFTEYKFNSITEFGLAVEQAHKTDQSYMSMSNGNDYDNAFSLRDAIHVAAHEGGYWPQGAKDLANVKIDVDRPADGLKRAIVADVVGFLPHVANYLAGHPQAMLNVRDTTPIRKFIRLGLHHGGSASTSQETRLNRGKAILAVVNELEANGYAVEVTACWRNSGEGHTTHVDVIIKQSDGVWNTHTAAFALCNTSFQRRLVWCLVESLNDPISKADMGSGQHTNGDEFDIYFPYITRTVETKLSTPTKALEYVLEQVTKHLET